jgi:hypothetical protein
MFRKEVVAVGAALVLGSFLVATDASAAGPRGVAGPQSPAVRPIVRPAVSPVINAGAQKSAASRLSLPSGNSNFGMSGPYVGLKYIGNQ